MSVFLAAGLAAAHPQGSARVADSAAAVARTFYVSGSLVSASGSPMSLAGLASLTVTTTGEYTGTLVLAGPEASHAASQWQYQRQQHDSGHHGR